MFQNPEGAERSMDRLERHAGFKLDGFLRGLFEDNASPDLALTNLERWIDSASNPQVYLEQMLAVPALSRLLVSLFGASQPIADAIIQNPELGMLVLEPGILGKPFDPAAVRAEGVRLLRASTSYRHSLDRLRFLKQHWNLVIVMNDLSGTWHQEVVWHALSDLADILIELTLGVAWEEFSKQKGIELKPEWMLVAFGKLGGSELNYSSDVDLVYVIEDGVDERMDRDCTRFFEAFGRALSDRMGRGSLYRVDLRLRPYGGAGPILRSIRACEAYYQLYAEPWEVQALLRSRPVVGTDSLRSRWDEVRRSHCFRPKLSEISLEQMLEMKSRIEQGASENDLKRGEGGIRDVEFLTQILQMLHGHRIPELQVRDTCGAVRRLEAAGFFEPSVASSLISGYQFLRKLEHRTQLVGDLQTHSIPTDEAARHGLAKLMGCHDWNELGGQLDRTRRTIQGLFRITLGLDQSIQGVRPEIQRRLGALAPAAFHWFDGFPESEAFYQGLVENQGSLGRVLTVLKNAPILVTFYKASISLTELLMSGEILEVEDPVESIRKLPMDSPMQRVGEAYNYAFTLLLSQWTLGAEFSLGPRLTTLVDALIQYLAKRMSINFDIISLGSYGVETLSPGSDGDLLFLIKDPAQQARGERQAQEFLGELGHLKRFGAPISFDMRLRPEGGKGLLVRSYDGVRAYDLEGMQMWERFALGQSRLVFGNLEAQKVIRHSAYGLPLSPERVLELTKMKRRIETERVRPQHIHRDIKLGWGGISDIEWLVHLTEMRYPTESLAETSTTILGRIRRLVSARLMNAIESENLIEAYRFLQELRARIYLNGLERDLLPENPDKLNRLAISCGFSDGNSLLQRHHSVAEPVRRMYIEGVERLKL